MNIVNHEGFIEWTRGLLPNFVVPHRTTIKQTILGMCLVLVRQMRKVMNKVMYLCITDDGWTSRANDSFLVVTGHWLTEDFEPRSCTLSLRHIAEAHTADAIAGAVQERKKREKKEKYTLCCRSKIYYLDCVSGEFLFPRHTTTPEIWLRQ
jgi:hypothetical protein